jgi:hypothetical protein
MGCGCKFRLGIIAAQFGDRVKELLKIYDAEKGDVMKNLIYFLSLALCLFASGPAFGQTNPTDEKEKLRATIQAERKALVDKNMGLTEEEGKVFWPLYAEYQKELAKLNKHRLDFIDSFGKDYEKMTDQKAKDLMDEWVDIQKEALKVKSSYIGKFGRVLPMKKVARYFQIENKLEVAVDYELAQRIPLLK